jgi:hypothetical protein
MSLPLLAMTKVEGLPPKDGNGRGGSSRFSDASPKAVIASSLEGGNPVGGVVRDARTIRWYAQWFRWIAASPRSGLLAMTAQNTSALLDRSADYRIG